MYFYLFMELMYAHVEYGQYNFWLYEITDPMNLQKILYYIDTIII